MDITTIHPLTTTDEFALLIRRTPNNVRYMVRVGEIQGKGRPAMINVRESEKFGLEIDQALELLSILRTPVPVVVMDQSAA